MKKITLMLALALGASPVFGQPQTFEGHLGTAESYDNGSGGAGNFIFNDLEFTNYYDQGWSSWNGFAISNITDNTTAGWGNQYASYTGAGAGGSETYAVFFPTGEISVIGGGSKLYSFKITNTAYAAISMRDGDMFGKQFGSVNGADGNPDGTNGEDFFRVWIIASDESGTQKDSLEFYLADYRFPNSQDDYIVDTWETVDLSNLSIDVAKITFRFESSDVGAWGINTPQYFAIDDVTSYPVEGIDEYFASNIRVYPNPVQDKLSISGIENASLILLNQLGQEIWKGNSNELESFSFSRLENGMYLLQVSKDGFQTTLSIIR